MARLILRQVRTQLPRTEFQMLFALKTALRAAETHTNQTSGRPTLGVRCQTFATDRSFAPDILHPRQPQRFFHAIDGQLDRITHVPTCGVDFMAIDRARGERERFANDLPLDDFRGLLSDRQSTCHALPLDLKLEHERASRHGGALPSAIPHIPGVLAGDQREGEVLGASRERHVDGRRDRVTGRADDRERRDCQSTVHLETSVFASFVAQQYAAQQYAAQRYAPGKASKAGSSLRTWLRHMHEPHHGEMRVGTGKM